MKRETIIKKSIKGISNPNQEDHRNFLITLKAFPKFVKEMDRHWKKKGYKSRSRYLLTLAKRNMGWKGPY